VDGDVSTLEEIRSSGTLLVVPWHDEVIDALGHDPRSYYVERFWLPVLGPSTIFLLRLLASALEAAPEGSELDLAETARRLGLGERSGRHAPIVRTVGRCVDFDGQAGRTVHLGGAPAAAPACPPAPGAPQRVAAR
jgi:hypothetical protein